MSYTGQISNSINTKEDKLMHSNLVKDWRNGWNHNIPISGNFTLFNYINVSPSFNFRDRMYTHKVMQSWDAANQRVQNDTIYGFNNVYDYNFSIGLSTKLYGFLYPTARSSATSSKPYATSSPQQSATAMRPTSRQAATVTTKPTRRPIPTDR